ncbi:hypothetical protein AB4427_09750 [Vibrio artabrorum]|uniref:hypothetical protein n=1 Tax=Vibrio artabrorum TaxID=446374 RepID=UPI00354BE59F
MTKSCPIQTYLTGQLKVDFEQYRQQSGQKNSECARDLLEFALRIKLNASEDDRPSNRELLEEIYRRVRHVSANVNIIHTERYSNDTFDINAKAAAARRKFHAATTNNNVNEFLEGKNKE